MTWPTWDSEGQKAINRMGTWEKIFTESDQLLAFQLKLASVKASGWAWGKTEQECANEAARRLREGD